MTGPQSNVGTNNDPQLPGGAEAGPQLSGGTNGPGEIPMADIRLGDIPREDIPLGDVTLKDDPPREVPMRDIPLGDDGEPVFAAPWEAAAFALAVRLSGEGYFTWDEWAAVLSEEILAAQRDGAPLQGARARVAGGSVRPQEGVAQGVSRHAPRKTGRTRAESPYLEAQFIQIGKPDARIRP